MEQSPGRTHHLASQMKGELMLLDLLKIPPIAPDEDILGWVYAIADANGWDHKSFVSAFFPEWYGPFTDDHYTIFVRDYHIRNYTKYYEMYAHLGFPTPQEMLMKHTAIPVSGLFVQPEFVGILAEVVLNGSNAEIEPINRPRQAHNEPDILEHPPFRYCPFCVKEDMEKYGRLVAHVPHQMMGRDIYVPLCHRHMVPLVKYEELPFASTEPMPAKALSPETTVDFLYKEQAVGDATDIVGSYRERFRRNVRTHEMDLYKAAQFTPEELLEMYDKSDKYIDLAMKAAEVMSEYCSDVKQMGYTPFPFLRYRCEGRRKESISYILSLTSGMTCRLCGKCKGETVPITV